MRWTHLLGPLAVLQACYTPYPHPEHWPDRFFAPENGIGECRQTIRMQDPFVTFQGIDGDGDFGTALSDGVFEVHVRSFLTDGAPQDAFTHTFGPEDATSACGTCMTVQRLTDGIFYGAVAGEVELDFPSRDLNVPLEVRTGLVRTVELQEDSEGVLEPVPGGLSLCVPPLEWSAVLVRYQG